MTVDMNEQIAKATEQIDKAQAKAENAEGVWGVISHVLVAGAHLVLGYATEDAKHAA